MPTFLNGGFRRCCRTLIIAILFAPLSGCITTVLLTRCESWKHDGSSSEDFEYKTGVVPKNCGAKCGCLADAHFVNCESGAKSDCFSTCVRRWDLECDKWVTVPAALDFITREQIIAKDATPDPFTFAPQNGVALSTVFTSNTVTVKGIDFPAPISIDGGEYSINGGAFTAGPAIVKSGDTIAVKLRSSNTFFTEKKATLEIGAVRGTFSVTTLAAEVIPQPFTFSPVTDVGLNISTTSNAVTVAGINAPVLISISGGEYSINGKSFTSDPGTVQNGDVVTVRQTSSDSYSTTTNATLSIEGVNGTFSVTTTAELFSPYRTKFSAAATVKPKLTTEAVDVEVTEGEITTYSAAGAISGEGNRSITKRVIIQTGSYAGWGFEISTYSLAGYTGTEYNLFKAKERRGLTTGDIHAVRRKTFVNNSYTLDITSVNDIETAGTITYKEIITTAGTSTTYTNKELSVYDGIVWSGTASGHYRGPLQFTSTGLYLPSFDVTFGEAFFVQSKSSGGTIYFIDLPSAADRLSIGAMEGGSAGLFHWVYTAPPEIGTTAAGSIEHVFKVDKVPVTVGSNVMLKLRHGIDIVLSDVTAAGDMTVKERPDVAAPEGFDFMRIANELSTTATFTGPVTVCFTYNEKSFTCFPDKDVQLFKYNASSNTWDTITVSRNADNKMICGTMDSLALFSVCCRSH